MLAVTLPICAVPAPRVTEPAIVCVPVGLAVTVPAIVTVLPTVTVPVIVPKVTVESLASTFIDPPAET